MSGHTEIYHILLERMDGNSSSFPKQLSLPHNADYILKENISVSLDLEVAFDRQNFSWFPIKETFVLPSSQKLLVLSDLLCSSS